MKSSIYQAMGGAESVRALAEAWHRRCLDDEVVSHAFSHPGQHPHHLDRLAAYWGEALGGPPMYTQTMANQQHVVVLHSGNGLHPEMDDRAIACFVSALDDVGFTDQVLRQALTAYFRWSTQALAEHPDSADDVPATATVPHWSWEGRVSSSWPPQSTGPAALSSWPLRCRRAGRSTSEAASHSLDTTHIACGSTVIHRSQSSRVAATVRRPD